MNIEIRPIQTQDEYLAVEKLQREVWSLDDVGIVPNDLMVTAQRNGGLVLGAFVVSSGIADEQLAGLVFGFAGLSPDSRLKHCSHILGVAATHRNQNIGYRLKLAQRERVLAQGIDLITWTFDPLESRNANLNFHKLGATCKTYLQNLYGEMRDSLNIGMPSDRFQVDWHIASTHATGRLRGNWISPSLSSLERGCVPILNRLLPGKLPRPSQTVLPIQGNRLLIQIPTQFQSIKSTDLELALAWRIHTRALFESVFAEGYVVTDLIFEEGQSYYLLEKDYKPK